MKEARITGLTIETEHLTAKVMVAADNERDYVLGWKCGTSMMRMTQEDLAGLGAEIAQIEQVACVALYHQPSAEDRKMIAELEKLAAQVKAE